jgi:hypothetical protein
MWSLVITTFPDKQQRKSKGLSETLVDDQKKTTKKQETKKKRKKKQKNKTSKAQKQKPTDPTKHQE